MGDNFFPQDWRYRVAIVRTATTTKKKKYEVFFFFWWYILVSFNYLSWLIKILFFIQYTQVWSTFQVITTYSCLVIAFMLKNFLFLAATKKSSTNSRRKKQNSNGLCSHFHILSWKMEKQVKKDFHRSKKKANKRFGGI